MMSIRGRLLVSLLTGLGFLALTGGAFLYWCVEGVLSRQFDAALRAQAHAFGNLLKHQPDGGIEFEFSAESMPEFAAGGHSHFFEFWNADGTVLERSPFGSTQRRTTIRSSRANPCAQRSRLSPWWWRRTTLNLIKRCGFCFTRFWRLPPWSARESRPR
jgi:hypothetical protein